MESPLDNSSLGALLTAWLLVLGLSVGSFLNVVIARVPHGLSIVRPPSRCPKCGHQLSWYENIPLVSWLALTGRCRSCRAPISWRYPAVELLTGLLFLACLRRFDWTPELASALVLVCLLIPLTFIDLEYWILPHVLTVPGIVAGVALSAVRGLEPLRDAAIGAAVGFLLFWGLEWVGEKIFKKEALGGGDKFLLAMLGAFLSWHSLLGIVFLASLQGAVVGSLLLVTRGRAGPAPEPEGPLVPDSPSEQLGEESEPCPVPEPIAPEPGPALSDARSPSEDASAAPADGRPPVSHGEEEDDWVPGPTNIPFGPWLSIAALELMLLGPGLARVLPDAFVLLLGVER